MSEAGRYSPDGALLLTAQSSSSSICCIAVPSRPSARCTCSGSRRNRAMADDGIMHANVAWGCRGTSGAGKKGSPAANMALSSCANAPIREIVHPRIYITYTIRCVNHINVRASSAACTRQEERKRRVHQQLPAVGAGVATCAHIKCFLACLCLLFDVHASCVHAP